MSGVRRLRGCFTATVMVGLAASGCGTPTGPAADLQSARRRWAAAEPAAYQMTLEHQCFCGPEITMPVVVTVRRGQVESRRYAASGVPVDTRWAAAFPAVEGLFDIIEAATRHKAAHASAMYDPQRGYPVRIDIDYHANIADDEVTYLVGAFQPL